MSEREGAHIDMVLKDAVTEKITLSLHEYYNMLQKHDWHSGFSDALSTYRAGENHANKLKRVAETHPDFQALFDTFYAHHYSGRPWGTEKQPKPCLGIDNPKTTLTRPITGPYGVLVNHGEWSADVWDNTRRPKGTFLIEEIDSPGRKVAIVSEYQLARKIASHATSVPDGGYSDVMISNVSYYASFDDWL